MPSLDALERDLFDTESPASTAAIRQRIIAEATRQGVDPALALALAQRESRFDPRAVSPTEVEGLFQVTIPTGRGYGQTAQTRRDPDVSMRAGIGYLADLLKETKGDVRQALARYGDRNEPDFPEKVLANYARQKASLGAGGTQQVSRIDDLERALFGKGTPPGRLLQGTQPPAPSPFPATEPSDLVIPIEKGVAPPPPSGSMAPRILPGSLDEQVRGVLPSWLQPSPGTPAPTPLDLPTLGRGALATGINVAGGVGGTAAGGALGTALAGPVGTAPGALAGEMAGSGLARWLNVKLGFEEPGRVGDVLAVATPPVGRALMGAGKAVIRNLPGASAIGHELAEETLERLPGRYQPPTAARQLFQQAATTNPSIRTPELGSMAQTIVTQERSLAPGFRQPRLLRAAEGLLDEITTNRGAMDMARLEQYRQRLGLLIGQASQENWPQLQGLRRMYGALHGDLEQAAAQNVPGAQTLREAIQASRQEHALEQLSGLWSPGRGITTVEGNLANVHGRRILDNFDNLLAKDRVFAGSFTPEQTKEMRQTLQDVARMTSRGPADRGPLAGRGMPWIGRAIGVERALRGDPLTAAAIGLTVETAPYAIAALLQTAPGRAAVRQAFLQGDGRLTSAGLAILNQALRQQFGEQAPTESSVPAAGGR